jgi:hypothetical protein
MTLEITERFDGICVWRSSESGLYAASRDQNGVAVEPVQVTHVTPSLAVQIMMEDEEEAKEE